MKFFDSYPRFYETTATRLLPNRLHQRWRHIIDRNKAYLAGARVLDLASHDGRWAFAALKAGAKFVVGVEARGELVAHARDNFKTYATPDSAYSFIEADVVDYLASGAVCDRFDIVLNLGFFYHTLKHLEILEGSAKTGTRTMIIDTTIAPTEEAVIALDWDDASDPRHAIDHLSKTAKVPVGRVSPKGLEMMLGYTGYQVSEISWAACDDFSECEDYQ
ncbi:MAG: hypothetical protein ABL932_23755, partial [Terricaulis sp.]